MHFLHLNYEFNRDEKSFLVNPCENVPFSTSPVDNDQQSSCRLIFSLD